MFRTSKLQKIVKVPQVQVIDDVAKVPRSMRRQVPMIQDETEREDQKPKGVQISFSPNLKSRTDKAEVQTKMQTKNRDSRRTIEKGSREGDARRAGRTSGRFSSKKAPPDM